MSDNNQYIYGRCTLVSEALTRREPERQQKENSEAKRRASGLGRWESHFHVRIRFRFWMSLIGFDRDWSNRFDIENQSNQMPTVEANQRQGSKSEPDTNLDSANNFTVLDTTQYQHNALAVFPLIMKFLRSSMRFIADWAWCSMRSKLSSPLPPSYRPLITWQWIRHGREKLWKSCHGYRHQVRLAVFRYVLLVYRVRN